MLQDHLAKKQLEVIDEKFVEWTAGVSKTDARINIFNNLLNIPYGINLNIHDVRNCSRIFDEKMAHCIPKHFILAHMFQKLGLEVKLISIPFNWNSFSEYLPKQIRKKAENLPDSLHLACECKINNRWILVDCSLDSKLKALGFHINDNWDGYSNTIPAVVPNQILRHNTVDERLELEKRFSAKNCNKIQFFNLLNRYLAQLRL
ncbi:MAG: hypothetical protein U9R34_04295 [Nanoarchaeota archaeon]|nr:hypothetical protein [Nanoarchaeota archaeon]